MSAQDLPWSAIRDVLMNAGDWGTLVSCTMTPGTAILAPGGTLITQAIKAAADSIREGCLYGGVLQASNSTVWTKFLNTAAVLTPTAVGGISSTSVTTVTALRTPTILKWIGLQMGDVQTARNLP